MPVVAERRMMSNMGNYPGNECPQYCSNTAWNVDQSQSKLHARSPMN